MKIAQFDLYANHPYLVIGSSDPFDGAVQLSGGEAVVSSGRHLLVSVIAQVRLVRARIWQNVALSSGLLVFDGELALGRSVCVTDAVGLNRVEVPLELPGMTRIALLVDDLEATTSVDLIIGGAGRRGLLTAVAGLPLPATVGVTPEGGGIDEIDLILSDIDLQARRLSAAIKVMLSVRASTGATRLPARQELAYWLQAASIAGSRTEAVSMVDQIEKAFSGTAFADEDFARVARELILDRM